MPDRAVVITRPRAQAQALAQAVGALGRRAVVLPLLEIAPLEDTSALRAALADLPSYALVAFVSPNAVDAAFRQLRQLSQPGHPAGWPSGVAIGVVGEGSRAALARHGVTAENATIHCPPDPGASDSEHLLDSLDLAAFAGRRVLIVRGESGRELMADTLRGAGARVDTVAAYRRSVPVLTEALAAELSALLAQPNDWIITSSEALRGLAGLVRQLDPEAGIDRLQAQHLIVPHPRIAETAHALGCGHVTLTGSGDARLLVALSAA